MKDHEPQEDKVHQFANLFPMMSDTELAELARDIEENGQQNPIIVDHDGFIVDGRNRLAACKLAGIEPVFLRTFFANEERKLEFVVSQNVHRRHLDTSQRAMIAGRLRESFDALAKARQTATLKKGTETPVVEKLPERDRGRSRDKAGAVLNVSGRTVDMATKVIERAVPEVIQAVERGDLAVSRAVKIADLPREEQAQAIQQPSVRQDSQLYALVRSNGPVTLGDVAPVQSRSVPSKGWIVFPSYEDALDEGMAYFDVEEFDAVPVAELLRTAKS